MSIRRQWTRLAKPEATKTIIGINNNDVAIGWFNDLTNLIMTDNVLAEKKAKMAITEILQKNPQFNNKTVRVLEEKTTNATNNTTGDKKLTISLVRKKNNLTMFKNKSITRLTPPLHQVIEIESLSSNSFSELQISSGI